MGKIAGNGANFRPHLNCCDPDAIHDYSPPAFRWSINVSDIDLVKRPNDPDQRPAERVRWIALLAVQLWPYPHSVAADPIDGLPTSTTSSIPSDQLGRP